MYPMRSFIPLVLVAGVAAACGSIPNETDPPPIGREVAPTGVMRGTLVYSGPHPCSSSGHVVGAAIIFVFDRRNPPPPTGLATTPVNFTVVEGDLLFPAEPRNSGPSTYCPPKTDTITSSAPFAVSPIPGGEYIVQAFYDYTGDFLPNFTFRNLPELGDVGGGVVDTVDALKPGNAGNPNYMPHFFPIDVGMPEPLPDGSLEGGIPNFAIPPQGFVADNLTVTVGSVFSTPRPYFYAAGMQVSFDPSSGALTATEVQTSATAPTSLKGILTSPETKSSSSDNDPILTIPQDLAVLAAPNDSMTEANVNNFESKFPRLVLHASLPPAEVPVAIASPFHFQIPLPVSTDAGAPPPSMMMMGGAIPTTFNVWQNAIFDETKKAWEPQDIPEGGGVAQLWPLVVLSKLDTSTDPYSIKAQGDPTHPVIIMEGITLLAGDGSGDPTKSDSLFNTATAESFGSLFDMKSGQPVVFPQDHLTVLMRPAAICFNTLFDTNNPDKRGTLVTPKLLAQTADLPPQPGLAPIVPTSALSSQQFKSQVKGVPTPACMPTGRYAINIVYPDGQAWTVPNESGVCASAEGSTNYKKLTCTAMPRPVLRSQGQRAVVEVTASADCAQQPPAACLPIKP
jgi:hypothetical protein